MMSYWLVVFVTFSIYNNGIAEKIDNHTLVRIWPSNSSQLEALVNFFDKEDEEASTGTDRSIVVFKPSRGLHDRMDVLVSPQKMQMVHDYIDTHGLTMETISNYGRRVADDFEERTPRRRYHGGNPAFQYKSFDAINKILSNLHKTNKSILKLDHVGDSFEGRRMILAKISLNHRDDNPIIFIDAGVHAREWVASAMALYLINRLVTDPDSAKDLYGVDWYILPVVNPDGYEYTRKRPQNRLWRKTRSRSQVEGCFGVDGNRNYGFKWGVSGVSSDPCSRETYAGPAAFSEPETQTVKEIMTEYSKRIKLYVSLHSYGQYLVYPWGYTGDKLPTNWKKLDTFAQQVSRASVKSGGPPFKVLSAGQWYPAAGGSDDYAFGAVGIPYSYTMELTEGYEFMFPERLLSSMLPKLFPSFRTMGRLIANEFN